MLVVIFGPPAVGKMTVGRALCSITDFHLFHNHMTIEPLLETFGYGTVPIRKLDFEFRKRVFQEAKLAGLELVFTVVWGLEMEDDAVYMRSVIDIFHGDVAFVELRANPGTRLIRNHTPQRLAGKRSKRDSEWSDKNVRELDRHVMASLEPTPADELLNAHPHLIIDSTDLSAGDVAEKIKNWLETVHHNAISPLWTSHRDNQVPDDVARLLATVPEWFGREESNLSYVNDARTMQTWTVRAPDDHVVGVTLVAEHFPTSAEVHLTVVDRKHHGSGVGSAMIHAIEDDCRRRGFRLLQVKTLGASHPDQHYARTRFFYEKMGFLPLEETELWGEGTPCLIMVKPLR